MAHLLIVSAYYPPHLGGVERYTHNIVNTLLAQGHEVTLLTSRTPGVSVSRQGLHLVAIPSHSIMDDRFPVIIPNLEFARLVGTLRQGQYDGVVINTRYYPICFLATRIAIEAGIRPVVLDHSSGFLSNEKSALGRLMRLYERWATHVVGRANPEYYCVSRRGIAWLKTLGIDAKGVIPNSIDAEEYRALSSGRQWRNEYGIYGDVLIVYAGRLIPEKGILKLIQAMDLLKGTMRCRLLIAGDGPLRETVQNLQSESVDYVGSLSPEDMSSLFSEADIFCLPTEYPEGLPTVLLEAAVQSTGIIVSDTGGSEEVIPTDEHGIVLDDTSSESIASAIDAFVCDSGYLNRAQHNVNRHVSHSFSWSRTASMLLSACAAAGKGNGMEEDAGSVHTRCSQSDGSRQ